MPIPELDPSGLFRGRIERIEPDGRVLVAPLPSGTPVFCDCLDTGGGPLRLRAGDIVVCLAGANAEDRFVLGRVTPPCAPGEPADAEPEPLQAPAEIPRTLVLEGRESVVIKTERAKIVLRGNGDIELLGERIASRARRIQKLLAPLLKLN